MLSEQRLKWKLKTTFRSDDFLQPWPEEAAIQLRNFYNSIISWLVLETDRNEIFTSFSNFTRNLCDFAFFDICLWMSAPLVIVPCTEVSSSTLRISILPEWNWKIFMKITLSPSCCALKRKTTSDSIKTLFFIKRNTKNAFQRIQKLYRNFSREFSCRHKRKTPLAVASVINNYSQILSSDIRRLYL